MPIEKGSSTTNIKTPAKPPGVQPQDRASTGIKAGIVFFGVLSLLAAFTAACHLFPHLTGPVGGLPLYYSIPPIAIFAVTTLALAVCYIIRRKRQESQIVESQHVTELSEASQTSNSEESNASEEIEDNTEAPPLKSEDNTEAPPLKSEDNTEAPPLKRVDEEVVLPEGFDERLQNLKEALLNDRRGYNSHYQSFSSFFTKMGLTWDDLSYELKHLNETNWNLLSEKIRRSAIKAAPFIKNGSEISWITGTRSNALIGIDRASQRLPSKKPSLVPTGTLLNFNIVPLTGELFIGITRDGINRESLSGVRLPFFDAAKSYASKESLIANIQDEKDIIMKYHWQERSLISLLRLKIAALRLIHLNADPKTLEAAKEHLGQLRREMDESCKGWQELAPLVGEKVGDLEGLPPTAELQKGSIVGLKRSNGEIKFGMVAGPDEEDKERYNILVEKSGATKCVMKKNLTTYDPVTLKQKAQAFPISTAQIAEIGMEFLRDKENVDAMDEILNLFETEKPLDLTSEEKSFIEDSFPIIWGSTSTDLHFIRVHTDIQGEAAVQGALEIGSQITVAFTKKNKVQQLQSWLDNRGLQSVTVMSFGAGRYLNAQA